MATGKLDLWIDRKESLLGLERDQLTWRLHGKLKDRVPVKYVNTVTILGQTQLDSRLLCRLAECGVSVYLLNNARNSAGTAIGQTFAGPPRQRLLQYQCTSDKSQGLSVARVIVYGKLSAYWHAGVNRFSFSESWGDSIKTLMTQIDAAQILPQLLGIEGAASRSWFEQLKQRIPEDWKFEGRNKNPPKDPVNALLSLT
ncbi:MAG: CRISPR-associated endonuclease Cas1, partial [Gammaproteobacteria bacterium]